MLGDINPQTIKITSQAVVYPGRDHVTTLNIKRFNGRSYSAVDTSLLTRVVLAFPQTDPVIAYDTATAPTGTITWSGSEITIDLSDFSMPASVLATYLIAYDAEHPNGQVLVDDNDSVLEFDFRNVSATGIVQPPVVELVSEAPTDGGLYGRQDGGWVSIEAIVAGVASVNGQTGIVVLDAADVGADATGTAAAAVAAHVALADPHAQYATDTDLSNHEADTTPHAVLLGVDRIGFDQTAGLTAGVAEMVWNDTDKTVDIGLPGGVTLQSGQEFLIRGLNNSGVTMTDGTAVYISGASGNRVVFSLADASQPAADKTIGVLTQGITNNQEGFCTIAGLIRGLNTSGWAEGSELWLSADTAGALTNVRPPAPNNAVRIGVVVRSHASVGSIFVRVQIIEALVDLHDVNIIAPADGDILEYDTATSTWINVPNTGGSGEANTASNLGAGTGLFAGKVVADLQFKSLVAGANITLTPDATTVTIAATGGGGGAVDSVNGETGVVVLDTDDIDEGVTNLYFTNLRASAAAPVQTVDGQTGTVDLTASYAPLSHVGDGGAAHANVIAAGAAGFMTGADKSKLDGVAAGANLYVHPNHTGDVTSTGDGAQVIAANAVTNAKLADMATQTIKGRTTAGTGDPEDLTAAQVRTIINVSDGATANSTDAFLLDRTNHTGTQAISTVTGLQTALDGKEAVLTAGTNITIDRTNPAAPIINAAGGGFTGGTLTTALNEAPAVTIASASTVNIGAATANTISITGTTTITAFDTIADGAVRLLEFAGALTLTHNGTSLILPTGANIVTAAGDVAEFRSLGAGNWRCVGYLRADGTPLAIGGGSGAGLPSRDVTASGAVTPADAGKWLICNSATPITLTIGAEATAAWTTSGILPMFHILQTGAGAVTVTGDGFSVTLHADDTNVLDGPGSAATALWRASNTWSLFGRLVAA